MFIVSNREITGKEGPGKFGPRANQEGSHELRIAEAKKVGNSWKLDLFENPISAAGRERRRIKDPKIQYGSDYAAYKLIPKLRKRKRNLLFFVHGFNNDVEAVLERAAGFEKKYNVEVLAFSWPANGGGVKGVASYKSDKRDARASVGALDRTLTIMHQKLQTANETHLASIHEKSLKFDDAELRDRYLTQQMNAHCPFTINLVLHSMGNYLFKQLVNSSIYEGNRLLFDNVTLVAPDTNNEGHADWVDKIRCRRRVYIAMNEDDAALMASRVKGGEEQKARLGHYPHNLYSHRAVYVDFTDAPHVGRSHSYFEGSPTRNGIVKQFFNRAFNGERAETGLHFDDAKRFYSIRQSG